MFNWSSKPKRTKMRGSGSADQSDRAKPQKMRVNKPKFRTKRQSIKILLMLWLPRVDLPPLKSINCVVPFSKKLKNRLLGRQNSVCGMSSSFTRSKQRLKRITTKSQEKRVCVVLRNSNKWLTPG